jgi:predicted metal-dependent HD superfamily phosphohydrolase
MDISLGFWLKVTQQWGADRSECVAVYKELADAYCGKNRHYHDLTHIEHMLSLANQVSDQIEDHDAMYFAIWFHDVIQKLGCDSEQLSADFAAEKLMALGAPKTFCQQIIALIVSTDHGQAAVQSGDETLLVDIDLAILGVNRVAYQAYSRLCRKEYKIPECLYVSGRKKVLKAFLSQAQIFKTSYFFQRYENNARNNILWELSL